MPKNAFDELLATFTEDGDREAFKALGEKNPGLRDAVMLRSDYSRRMDEVRDKVTKADAWEKWATDSWVHDAYGEGKGATKRELEKDRQIAELSNKLAEGGEVDFDALKTQLDGFMKEKGVVSKTDLDGFFKEREETYKQYLDNNIQGHAYVATRIPYLMAKYGKEFGGDIMDPDAFLKAAVEANNRDLDKFYDSYVSAKREEIRVKETEAKIAAAREEGRKQALLERTTSDRGPMPTDQGPQDVGHFFKSLQGEKTASPVPDGAKLGDGLIARVSAREFERREIEGKAS